MNTKLPETNQRIYFSEAKVGVFMTHIYKKIYIISQHNQQSHSICKGQNMERNQESCPVTTSSLFVSGQRTIAF